MYNPGTLYVSNMTSAVYSRFSCRTDKGQASSQTGLGTHANTTNNAGTSAKQGAGVVRARSDRHSPVCSVAAPSVQPPASTQTDTQEEQRKRR